MATDLVWESEVPGLFTARVCSAGGSPLIHLVAESTTGGSWDWAAWPSRSFGDSALCGVEVSRLEAMRKAEFAARTILVARVLKAA